MEYLKYPTSQTEAARELKRLIDDYKSKTISNELLESTIKFWIQNCRSLFYNNSELAPIVKRIVGSKRCALFELVSNNVDQS